MKHRIILVPLVASLLLAGCTLEVSSAPTAKVPSATATTRPTVTATITATATATVTPTPTETAVATVTPEPTVWDIAKTMLAECKKGDGVWEYHSALHRQANIPSGNWTRQTAVSVLKNNGNAPSPFADFDFPFTPDTTMLPVPATWEWEEELCLGYLLVYENVQENHDSDGILVGEAYLFYEVGGNSLTEIDGDLKEVHFFFPAAPAR